MAPPKLSVEQEQIYNALTDAAGTNISLKYPKSGKYLSAFIVEDIDGDGGSEAVVFYEKTSLTAQENTLRINILDQYDGKWRSVCDTPAEGAEIDKVMISQLGSNQRINLIIGSSLINRSEKNVAIYNYSPAGGVIEQTFSQACSFIDVTDLDGDLENEFLLLTGSSGGSAAEAQAYKLDADGKYHKYNAELSGSFTEFENISYGSLYGGQKGLYIDALSATGSIQTDVIYMDSSGLNKVFATPEDSLETLRPVGYSSYDVDGDGILEIPVQTIAPGYEEMSESEQMKLTLWTDVNKDGILKVKYSSYYSLNEGYIFIFPDKWNSTVTVRRDNINDEIVFLSPENGQPGRELMRIFCAEDMPSRNDRLSSSYMLMHTRGDSSYLVYIPPYPEEYSDGLSISAGDAALGFRSKEPDTGTAP